MNNLKVNISSTFNKGEDIVELIMKSSKVESVLQRNGNFQRVIEAGRSIGVDRVTGKATNVYTVITNKFNKVVTSFPGKP